MTAAELLVQVATRFWQAVGYALPKLPSDLQAALGWRVEDGDMRWALALMLAGWRLTDVRELRAAEVSQLLKQMGAGSIISQINALRALDGVEQFVDRARAADSEARLKAAAVSLTSCIERLDSLRMMALIGMLRRAEVREVGQQLIRRFPTPGSQRPAVYSAPPGTQTGGARGALFDRADYGSRDRALLRPTESVPSSQPRQESVEPFSVPPPVLDEHAVTAAYLHTRGLSQEQIARLMAGPLKKVT